MPSKGLLNDQIRQMQLPSQKTFLEKFGVQKSASSAEKDQ
jgi:hypothetical protein